MDYDGDVCRGFSDPPCNSVSNFLKSVFFSDPPCSSVSNSV